MTNEEKYARLPTANSNDKLVDKNSDEIKYVQHKRMNIKAQDNKGK